MFAQSLVFINMPAIPNDILLLSSSQYKEPSGFIFGKTFSKKTWATDFCVISLINIEQKWLPEINHHCRDIPFILVGTKSDIRNDDKYLKILEKRNIVPVSKSDATLFGERLGATNVLECSAKTQEKKTIESKLTNDFICKSNNDF